MRHYGAFQVYAVVGNVETVDVGWCIRVCVCSLTGVLGRFGCVSLRYT